jgi:hypothetical protein
MLIYYTLVKKADKKLELAVWDRNLNLWDRNLNFEGRLPV